MSCRFRTLMQRLLSAVALSLSVFGVQSAAQAGYPYTGSGIYTWSSYGAMDPYAYYADFNDQLYPAGGDAPDPFPERTRRLPTVEMMMATRTQPFGVGYSLTGGYRPFYTGVEQPVGHTTTMTHGGNGYVYQPVYASAPTQVYTGSGSNHGYGYSYNSTRALVINNPGTPYETRGANSSQGYAAAYGGGYYGAPDYGTAAFAAPLYYGIQPALHNTEPFGTAETLPTPTQAAPPQAAPPQAKPQVAPGPGPTPKKLEPAPSTKREY